MILIKELMDNNQNYYLVVKKNKIHLKVQYKLFKKVYICLFLIIHIHGLKVKQLPIKQLY